MGWGETECLVKNLLLEEADIIGCASKPIVGTKFTPSPSRTTVQSVVEACEKSRQRLGVESIDLYQIQMPDIVKVSHPYKNIHDSESCLFKHSHLFHN